MKQSSQIDFRWMELAAGMLRCPDCSTSAIETSEPARHQVEKVRTDLQAMGFGLQARVRVALVTYDELEVALQSKARGILGVTSRALVPGAGPQLATRVLVLRGLPALWFARTLVHENMHAWIGENAVRFGDLVLEEGACEVLSYEWLRRQRGTYPAAVAESLLASPDPVYGEGLRRLLHVCRSGQVPPELQNNAVSQLMQLCQE
jgi:hypothetical protein